MQPVVEERAAAQREAEVGVEMVSKACLRLLFV